MYSHPIPFLNPFRVRGRSLPICPKFFTSFHSIEYRPYPISKWNIFSLQFGCALWRFTNINNEENILFLDGKNNLLLKSGRDFQKGSNITSQAKDMKGILLNLYQILASISSARLPIVHFSSPIAMKRIQSVTLLMQASI
jgi:hypothetical protein